MNRLDNPVRDYAWGSAGDIPGFLGTPAPGGPVAELWIGAHPDSPSQVVRDGQARSLAEVIAADPAGELGPGVAARFGPRLPFLLKLISAARPLSLQVHPDKDRAQARFAAQQRDGAAGRDYTDDNHKPELVCALRDGFSALCGFRPLAATRELLAELAVPGLADVAARLGRPAGDGRPAAGDEDGGHGHGHGDGEGDAGRVREVVTEILTGPGDPAPVIGALRAACERVAAGGGSWAAACRGYAVVAAAYPADPGVLVALLLNHVELAAGDGVFVGAGVPHCYLSGFAAELMACSDNVLRAGLTPKRVNIAELLAILDFRPAPPVVLHAEPDGPMETYQTPVADFRLSRLRLDARPAGLPGGRAQIVLCTEGVAVLAGQAGQQLRLRRGESAYLSAADEGLTAAGPDGPAVLLRATTGPGT